MAKARRARAAATRAKRRSEGRAEPLSRGASESDVVRRLGVLFGGPASRRVASLGIGDDAAVLRRRSEPLVWTIDTAIEGVHFLSSWLSLVDLGARSFHAAVSDLAAMGASPVAALSNLVVPASLGGPAAIAIAKGQAKAARELGCPVVGGNLSRGDAIAVTTTVLGAARRPLVRDGALPGDELWLVGDVGLAGAGRHWLSRFGTRRRPSRAAVAALRAFRSPRARLREGLGLVGRARSAIDVSDGLALDAGRIAEASGVRLVLEEPALRAAMRDELASVARSLELDPLELMLGGGEDYALVATGPRRARPRWARRVGRVERGRGVVLESEAGRARDVSAGFDHFSGQNRHGGRAKRT